MLFFASGQGRLTVVPAQINQNSNGANTIYLTGAFPWASVVTVAFTLPDGTNTEPQLMTGDNDNTVDYDGLTLAVKEYTLPKNITQVQGSVKVQFYITNGSETLATEATNITIARGVPSLTPADPNPSIYEDIRAALSSIQTELTNKLDKVSGSTPYDMIYAKSSTGEQKMKASSSSVLPALVVERDDVAGINVPYAQKPTHAVPLKQLTEKLAAYIAAAIATKLDIAGGTITGDLDVDGDLVVSGDFTAKGKTFIEKATTLAVKNAIIETNAGKTDLKTFLSGLVINKNSTTSYGFVYDPTDDTVKFGQGSVDENGVFTFKTGEGSPVATRADDSTFTAEHLVKWDNTKKRFVDAGKSISEVGKTPKSIDAVNGAFTSVTYDTTDGITLVSITKIINTDDSEYTATLSQEIPLISGNGLSMDVMAGQKQVEIKIDPSANIVGATFEARDNPTSPLEYTRLNYPGVFEYHNPMFDYTFRLPVTGNSGIYQLLASNYVRTLFGNQSIVGSGNIDLYQHNISFTSTDQDKIVKFRLIVISSKNFIVTSLRDIKTLLGNTFTYPVNGGTGDNKSVYEITDMGYKAGATPYVLYDTVTTYPAGTWTDTVTTI